MPAFVPRSNGLLTDATIFGKCCHFVNASATSTGGVTTVAGSFTGASVTNGNSFTLASPTEVDAIGFLQWYRNPSPDGVLNAYIVTGGVEVAGTRCQIAVHQLPVMTYDQAGYGWVILKMVAPVTLAAGTYNVAFNTTNGSQIQIHTNTNIAHLVRTTEQAAPGDNDTIIVGGEYGFIAFSDIVSQDTVDFSALSGWTQVGGGTQSQTLSSGALNFVVTSGTGDPTKYVRSSGYFGTDMMVKCKIRVNSITANTNGRVGISVRSTTSGQGGLSLLFRGDSTNNVIMLNEGIAFSSQYPFIWTTGVWYQMRLLVQGNRMYGKVWADSNPEPNHWMLQYTHNGARTNGYASLIGANSGAASNADFDDFEVFSVGALNTFDERLLTIDTVPSSVITFTNLAVSRGGTARFDVTKDTLLRFTTNNSNSAGLLYPVVAFNGGRFEIGSTTTPIPAAYTATLEGVGGATADIIVAVFEGGTFLAHGTATRTRRTTLTANTAAGSSTLTHGTVSGWAAGDLVAVCGTSRANYPGSGTNQNETRTIGTPGTTSTVVTSSFTYAHDGGVTPTGSGHTFGAMLINLTRNVRIQGTTTSSTVSVYYGSGAILDVRHVQHRYWGSANNPRRGYYLNGNTVGTARIEGCSFYDLKVSSNAMCVYHLSGMGYVSMLDNVAYGVGSGDYFYYNESIPAQNDGIITGNACINFNASSYALNDPNIICSDNWAGGCSVGIQISSIAKTMREADDNWFYNCNYAIFCDIGIGYVIDGWRAWRTREVAIWNNQGTYLTVPNINGRLAWEISNFIAAGCGSVGAFATLYHRQSGHMIVRDSKVYSDPSATVTNAWANGGEATTGITEIINCVLGVTGYAFTSAVSNRGISAHRVHVDNCALGISGSPVNGQTSFAFPHGSGVAFSNYNQVNGDNRTYKGHGTLQTDTAIYRTASPSMRLTPLSATIKMTSEGLMGGFLVPCAAGSFKTINVYVRKSVIGDGATYNGGQPRLMLKANSGGGGQSLDVAIATAAGSAGTWELLTGVTPSALIDTTFEFYIDCDGTTGWVNVDDISIA